MSQNENVGPVQIEPTDFAFEPEERVINEPGEEIYQTMWTDNFDNYVKNIKGR
jgi:hypothetical protein